MNQAKEFALDLINFLDKSPTASHTIETSAEILKANGFKEIKESDKWEIKPGDKFYVIRHNTSLIAAIAGNSEITESGYTCIGSHTDSPTFTLKPNSVYKKDGFIQLGVEVYGGPLYSTWTNKELSLAGLVAVKNGNDVELKLVKIDRPILMIPQVAIHFNRDANTGLNLNPQTHMAPIMGISGEEVDNNLLKNLLGKELGIKSSEIVGFELELIDLEKGRLAGLNEEFIASRGIDNKSMVHASIHALIESGVSEKTSVIALFDSEEVGSSTTNGGNSSFVKDFLTRISGGTEQFLRATSLSYFMSADGAHAVHPNYPEHTEFMHKVYINKGPAVKISSRKNYATNINASALFEKICVENNIPLQKFVNRADVRGGGTIGSMIATNLGIRTLDLGNPMLAMHSTREIAGVEDHLHMKNAMKQFLKR
ncbi:MAG: M18 family aminopeptidase [Candidatus Delongbacteria bacterium]|nr:M18 family aminopeptidase [Candidatus Delongbacteria bacterium]MBN2833340.1 M18 family aminopeptidase [Candidatus Delongbacteria bacterium]